MKKIYLVFLGLILSAGCVWAQAVPAEPSVLRFESRAYGFNLQHPSTWEEQVFRGTIITFIAPLENENDNFQENVNLIMHPLDNPVPDLKAYSRHCLREIKRSLPGVEISDISPATLGGMPAYSAVYTVHEGALDLKFKQVWAIKGNRAYVLTYTAEEKNYQRYLPQATKIVDTLQFMGDSADVYA